MKAIRASFAVIFVLASVTMSFGSIQPTVHSSISTINGTTMSMAISSLPSPLSEGPAPRPLCPPDVETCPSLPLPLVRIAEGPAPRPLCPPDVEVCPSLPLPL